MGVPLPPFFLEQKIKEGNQMAEDQSRYWTPNRTYEFVLKVGKKDITNDVHKITILTSLDVPYQTFIIDLILDANDLILDEF